MNTAEVLGNKFLIVDLDAKRSFKKGHHLEDTERIYDPGFQQASTVGEITFSSYRKCRYDERADLRLDRALVVDDCHSLHLNPPEESGVNWAVLPKADGIVDFRCEQEVNIGTLFFCNKTSIAVAGGENSMRYRVPTRQTSAFDNVANTAICS